MDSNVERRLAMIETKLDALLHLLITTVSAADTGLPGIGLSIVQRLSDQSAAAVDQGKVPLSFHLDDYANILRTLLDLPVND